MEFRSAVEIAFKDMLNMQKLKKCVFSCIFSVEEPSQFSRLRGWRDVGEGDIKIFLAHLIAMGLVRKGCLEKYWDHGETVKTPFFGTYMGRNTFQAILSNFQVSDGTKDLPRNHPHRDILFKVRPMLDMMDTNFVQSYKCGRDLSFDEGCCPFKGRVSFRCYNPSKPNKWHMKLFEVSDARTGYVIAFDIYTGKNKTRCAKDVDVLDPASTQITRTVLGLLKKGNLLGKGHHVYMDNYYSGPDLFWELFSKETYACGTCRSNRKNLPKALKGKLPRKDDCVFRRDGPLLALKWRPKKEKKEVLMLSTIHEAIMVETGKTDRDGNKIEKPEPVYYYCSRMGGVDLNDQLLNYFTFLRKSTKWSKKLLIHLFNLVILNAYILNRHYGSKKMTQDEYRDNLVKYLLREGLKCYSIPLPPVMSKKLGKKTISGQDTIRLQERHFITNIPAAEGRKRKRPTRCCFVCSKLPGLGAKSKRTSYWCEDCGKALCITPCFRLYHTEHDYKLAYLNLGGGGELVAPADVQLVNDIDENDADNEDN